MIIYFFSLATGFNLKHGTPLGIIILPWPALTDTLSNMLLRKSSVFDTILESVTVGIVALHFWRNDYCVQHITQDTIEV